MILKMNFKNVLLKKMGIKGEDVASRRCLYEFAVSLIVVVVSNRFIKMEYLTFAIFSQVRLVMLNVFDLLLSS